MIILDLNQTIISNILAQMGNHTNAKIEEDLVRHMVLNAIRSHKTKFSEYGELIIACDDRAYWRRNYFPYYKANRKKDREKSEINWGELFGALNKIKQELKDYFPYRVIQVEHAEADDVIGSLVHEFGYNLNNMTTEQILILSGDKDFIQLQQYANVKQYDPVQKKKITAANPERFAKELVLKGDRGDGVPNVLSPDNSIVDNIRQKSLRESKIDELINTPIASYPPEIRRNYDRNNLLINLDCIPAEIQREVLDEYKRQEGKGRDKLFNYFISHRLKNLLETIGDF